jgi:hypothetical protein
MTSQMERAMADAACLAPTRPQDQMIHVMRSPSMPHTHYEHTFEDSGKQFVAILNAQPDGLLSVTVRLPDGTMRVVPGEHFDSEDQAMAAASSFAHELVGSC